MSRSDRIALRVARLLVDGHCVISPFQPRLRLTLNGEDSPVLRALLGAEPQPVRGLSKEFALAIGNRSLSLGPVLVFHPRAAAADAEQILRALDTGQGEGMELVVRPADGERFRLVLQSALAGTTEPVPVPLGLPGFPEPR